MPAGNRWMALSEMLFPGDRNIFKRGDRQGRTLLHHTESLV